MFKCPKSALEQLEGLATASPSGLVLDPYGLVPSVSSRPVWTLSHSDLCPSSGGITGFNIGTLFSLGQSSSIKTL